LCHLGNGPCYADSVFLSQTLLKASLPLFRSSNPKIAYTPSQSDADHKYFNETVACYKQFGVTNILYVDIDKEYDERKNEELFACDGIYLSGGDTYYFLQNLQRRGYITLLRDYVQKKGVLIGVSAGSIIMSDTINITALHDTNTSGLTDYFALGLVDFEFLPHLNSDKEKYLSDLIEYSKISNTVIYACNDGDGILVDGGRMQFIGSVIKIQNGAIISNI
jgi:dipeptidase E